MHVSDYRCKQNNATYINYRLKYFFNATKLFSKKGISTGG